MADQIDLQRVRAVLGANLTDAEADALAAWYASLSRAVAAFPSDALRAVEPPLRSIPGPPVPDPESAVE